MTYQPSENQCDRCIRDRDNCLGNLDFSGMLKTAQINNQHGETTIVLCDQFEAPQESAA
ncbi:hypothetical protein [Marinobacterium lutimaris]|uniref:Uncharacterized protein n=1 Tax=Marinobacterium lutimaris TaxID=568106 RepID=A0A1H5XXR3_9GAMM|nr:hypothetical protein [Marinobacterium lutimaris]SEG16170.1 hypothetical protein SAMN05444390_1011532 [Marinobacterium lutimaris]